MPDLLTRCSATTLLPTDVGRAWWALEDLVADLWPGASEPVERRAGRLLRHAVSATSGGPVEGWLTWEVEAAAEHTCRVILTAEEEQAWTDRELDGVLAQLMLRCLPRQ